MRLFRIVLALLIAPAIVAAIINAVYELHYGPEYVYAASYLFAPISVLPVLFILRKIGKLSMVSFCMTYMMLGVLHFIAVYLPAGMSMIIVLLHYTEVFLVHALSPFVFALVFWIIAFGSRYKAYSNNKDGSDYGEPSAEDQNA